MSTIVLWTESEEVRCMYKQMEKYFTKHVHYNALVHVVAGMGLGILVTYPLVQSHPVRWGAGLLVLAVIGHLYPLTLKK